MPHTRGIFYTLIRDSHPAGQLCPYNDCCHDLAIPEIGWYECGNCGRAFYADDTDSDYEDYHCHTQERMDEDPPGDIPVAEDLGASWATPKENSMDKPERKFMTRLRDMLDFFLNKEGEEELERAVAIGDVYESIWNALFDEETWTMSAYPLDIFVENGALFAVLAREGKLYKVDLQIDEDGTVQMLNETQVLQQFVPVDGGRTRVFRQSDGKLRVIAVVCTAVMNRVGELDSTAMFDSFIEHAEEAQEYPIVNFFHQGERSRLGQADFLARDGFLYIASYTFDDNEFGEAAARGLEKHSEYFGHSIEFTADDGEMLEVVDGIKVPMYTRGVNTAITILGEESAAALFTAVKVTQGVQRMEPKIKADLLKLFDDDEELVGKFEEFVDGTNRTIVDENLIARAVEDAEVEDNLEDEAEVEDLEDETLESEEELEEELEEEDEDEEETLESEEVSEELDEVAVAERRDFIIDESVLDAIAENLNESNLSDLETFRTSLSEVQAQVDKIDRAVSGSVTKLQGLVEKLAQRVAELEKPQVEQNRNYLAQLPQQPRDRLIYRPSQERGTEKDNGEVSNLSAKADSVVEKWQGHD
jgi:hypothetical protein